jgi:hypothetical protein
MVYVAREKAIIEILNSRHNVVHLIRMQELKMRLSYTYLAK